MSVFPLMPDSNSRLSTLRFVGYPRGLAFKEIQVFFGFNLFLLSRTWHIICSTVGT